MAEFSNKRRKLQVTPKQANYMDPQVRMLLEVSWEAMIDAGTQYNNIADWREKSIFISQ